MAKPKLPDTVRGYSVYEVVSAYQKAIRRSDVDAAIYWGAELYDSGFANWAWKRLRIIVSEDIGPAAPGLPADVNVLWEWAKLSLKEKKNGGKMWFVHATILAARAPKCRVTDWALFASASTKGEATREIPDEALDMHTLRGKQMGRGAGHFVEEAGKLVQPDGVAPEEVVDPELLKLEKEYEAVFTSDQSRWRDPIDTQLPTEEEAEVDAPKEKKEKQPQVRLLP